MTPSMPPERMIAGAGGTIMLAVSALQYFTGSVNGATFMTFRTGVVLLIGAVTMPCRQQEQQDQRRPVLRGRVRSLRFNTTTGCSLKGSAIAGDHWDDEEDLAKPVVLHVGERGNATAQVQIDITESEGQPGSGALTGTLGDLRFECADCPLSAGTHPVTVKISGLPDCIERIRGSINWSLKGTSTCDLGATPVCAYMILDRLGSCFKGVVWTEVLDFLIERVNLAGSGDPMKTLALITKFCHSGHGLVYQSANHYAYADLGARFCLEAYLGLSDKFANCYDQASAVLVLGHALGLEVEYCSLNAFGFIKLTNLMGVAKCNNPCYTLMESTPCLDDPEFRTPFANHVCCLFQGKVFDACIGPYLGEWTLVEYLDNAIDDDVPKIYWKDPWVDKGKRLGQKLLRAKPSDARKGEIEILDRGPLGQVPRRQLSTLIATGGVRDGISNVIDAFQKLAAVKSTGGAIQRIEQILEDKYVLELSHLSPEKAIEVLKDKVLEIAVGFLNNEYDREVAVEEIRDEVEKANKQALLNATNKELEAARNQAQDRKDYVGAKFGTAEDFDKLIGKKIYPYDKNTLELL